MDTSRHRASPVHPAEPLLFDARLVLSLPRRLLPAVILLGARCQCVGEARRREVFQPLLQPRSATPKFGVSGCQSARLVGSQSGNVSTMPRSEFEEYYSAEELHRAVDLLNTFTGELNPWERVRARKTFIDLFGEEIRPGDFYYQHKGIAYTDVVRISILSMERLCYVLFERLQYFGTAAKQRAADREQKRMRGCNVL